MYHTPHNNQVYFKVENTKKSSKVIRNAIGQDLCVQWI